MFPLGKIMATAAIHDEVPLLTQLEILYKHESGNWGDIPEEDAKLNIDAAHKSYGRILSSYKTDYGKVWIITDGLGTEEVYTTLLYPNEY